MSSLKKEIKAEQKKAMKLNKEVVAKNRKKNQTTSNSQQKDNTQVKNVKNNKKENPINRIEFDIVQATNLRKMTGSRENAVFVLKSDLKYKYLDIFIINMQDYPNQEEDYVVEQAAKWDLFYRTNKESIKTVTFSLPINPQLNIDFYNYKLKKTQNPKYKNILYDNIEQFQQLKQREQVQSYLFVFAETYEKLMLVDDRVYSLLASSSMASSISTEEKIQVLRRINNPYSYQKVVD